MVEYCIYTNIFTLDGRDPSKNRYVDMFIVWLLYLTKYGKTTSNDYILILVDTVTCNFIKNQLSVKFIIENNFCQFRNVVFLTYPPPKTIKEGIMHRYNIRPILHITNNKLLTFFYMDVDNIIINPISNLIDITDNNSTFLFLNMEGGDILNKSYAGDVVTDEEREWVEKSKHIVPCGFGAGIFGWRSNTSICKFFDYIVERANSNNTQLYTIEQPFFNAAIIHFIKSHDTDFRFIGIPNNKIEFNTDVKKWNKDAVVINYAGEPGNEHCHWEKMLYHISHTIMTS